MDSLNLYWTDAHTNPHSNQVGILKEWLVQAKEMIDFWPVAYYPYYMRPVNNFAVEDIYDQEIVSKDWEQVQAFVRENNKDHDFPIFLGYEWQGAGLDGDHNVFYLDDDMPIHTPLRYETLCEKLEKGRAIAIPHHLAYQVGERGKNWATHNPDYSPFAEIYSSHGCSESDHMNLSMQRHVHMGPRTSGGTVNEGLEQGHKVGIIASGDNHSTPAVYGHGYMGVWAKDLTRESLWEAMLAKRVYGVTGDRIQLQYSANGESMGSTINTDDSTLQHKINIEGSDSIHRVELYRNNLLVNDYTHTGKWERSEPEQIVELKFRLELGWGPDTRVFHDITSRTWEGSLKVDGEILGAEKCWTATGQSLELEGDTCNFKMISHKTTQTGKWMGPSPIENQAVIFNLKVNIDSHIETCINGKKYSVAVRDLLQASKLFGLVEEAVELVSERFDVNSHYRNDPFWHNAYKIKFHQAVPAQSYKVDLTFDVNREKDNDFYSVKIFQTNGCQAWSSPIWIEPLS